MSQGFDNLVGLMREISGMLKEKAAQDSQNLSVF